MAYLFLFMSCALCVSQAMGAKDKPKPQHQEPLTYIWPLPAEFTFGDKALSVNPGLSLAGAGNGGRFAIVRAAFDRYKGIIFKNIAGHGLGYFTKLREVVLLFVLTARR